jgi:hypothetical protein
MPELSEDWEVEAACVCGNAASDTVSLLILCLGMFLNKLTSICNLKSNHLEVVIIYFCPSFKNRSLGPP